MPGCRIGFSVAQLNFWTQPSGAAFLPQCEWSAQCFNHCANPGVGSSGPLFFHNVNARRDVPTCAKNPRWDLRNQRVRPATHTGALTRRTPHPREPATARCLRRRAWPTCACPGTPMLRSENRRPEHRRSGISRSTPGSPNTPWRRFPE